MILFVEMQCRTLSAVTDKRIKKHTAALARDRREEFYSHFMTKTYTHMLIFAVIIFSRMINYCCFRVRSILQSNMNYKFERWTIHFYFSPHINYARKTIHSVSRVVSLFYQSIFAKYFHFQINGLSSAVRTNISQAVGPASNLCRVINFYDFTNICQKFQLFPWPSG